MSYDYLFLKNTIEAALMVAGEPLDLERLLSLFSEFDNIRKEQINTVIKELQNDYQDKALELVELATGFAIRVKEEFTPRIARLWQEKPHKPSRAFMETLAIIAYRQPITRAEIEEIRGVSVSSNIIKALLEKAWIKVVGHRDLPGKPSLFATTKIFLDHFSLKSLADLPVLIEPSVVDERIESLNDLKIEAEIEAPAPELLDESMEVV